MKRFLRTSIGLSVAFMIVCSPGMAFAEAMMGAGESDSAGAALSEVVPSSAVLISELLTGTHASGVQEFVELYNTTDDPIDLTGWQLWYVSGQAADQNHATATIRLGENTDTPIIPAHGLYVLSGRADYLPTVAQQFYSGTMAATGGHVRLLSPDSATACMWDVQDQVGWGNALYPEGQTAPAPPTDKSLVRQFDTNDVLVDTNNNATDFAVNAVPSPGIANVQRSTAASVPVATPLPTVPIAGCTPPVDDPDAPATGGTSPLDPPTTEPPATVIDPNTSPSPAGGAQTAGSNTQLVFPASDVGLMTPQITEVMPNPAAPQTDAADEFIELYNGNDVAFDLTGFQVQVGLTTRHHYTFPAGTSLAPRGFVSFFSVDTGLSLSNSGGQVQLLDPFGNVINSSDTYGTAKDGQSWALANGNWQWSTTPTPNAPNVVTLPVSASKKQTTSTASSTKKSSTAKTTAAITKPKAASSSNSTPSVLATDTPDRPLHPGVLAAVAGFALLYGAYEYRQDVANKLYQFRTHRAARRAARAETQGG